MSIASSTSRAALFFLRRAAYSSVAAAENVKARQGGAAAMRNRVETGVANDVFWMKDPKSGNWLPESHFDQVDVVELRQKFLSNKKAAS